MRNFHDIHAVSETIGEILLLAIAITSVAVLYTQFTDMQGPQDIANVTIIGQIEKGVPVFELQRGESLGSETTIMLTIAGHEKRTFLLEQLASRRTSSHEWHIGERIILPTEDITGLQVEATIVDQKTNSIVFWGVLQEGLILPPGGKGGIWHFNELLWSSIPNEVIDSSGNTNHGVAKNGAKIINGTLQPLNVKSQNAGYFDGINDYVKIDTSWSLNITNAITLEAWMKPQNPLSIVDIIELEEKFGFTPYIIALREDLYVLVSEDKGKGGNLATVEISPDGDITYLDNMYFGSSTSEKNLRPMITQLSGEIIIAAYVDQNLYMHLKTFHICKNGSITYTGNEHVFTDYKSTNNIPNRPSLQRITDNVCAIAYWAYIHATQPRAGILKTLTVSADGQITPTGERIQDDQTTGYEPCLVPVTGNIYALAYRGPQDKGIVKTYDIAPSGAISSTGQTIQFDAATAYEPCMIPVSGTLFAIAYRTYIKPMNYGCVKTFHILPNGSITWTGNAKMFEDSVGCFDPCIVHCSEDTYIITYATGNGGSTKGYYLSIRLPESGSIISPIDTRNEFDAARCYNPVILHVSEHLFAITYEGFGAHPGKLITLFIGQDTFPPYRGVFKKDSYGIYANTSTVVGSINNVMVSHPLSPGWHHFAVTYDAMTIRLYVDGYLVNSTVYENHLISKTKSNLYFGRYYCGFIDEIAIYDRTLTQEQVMQHFLHPGMLQ